MKIGITIDIARNSLFTSGINQNALYLGLLFDKGGHESYLIHSATTNPGKSLEQLKDLKTNVKLINFQDSMSNSMDIVISLGVTISKEYAKVYKQINPNIKFISYKCGNEFMVDAETYLYNTHEKRADQLSKVDPVIPDAIWSIPQMENTNLQYYSFLLGTDNSTVVPFVWDPVVVESSMKNSSINEYDGRKIKRIAIMEPSISLMKFCIPPSIIVNRVFKNQKDIEIEKLMLIGAQRLNKNKRFKNIINKMEIAKAGKMSAETRHPTPWILDNYAQMVVSWQWENALNYLYFDVAWMGYPIIHNAHFCKDIGYYYEGFNYEQGEEVVADAMRSHAANKDYLKNEKSKILRYTKENPKLIEQYNKLLENVVNGTFKRQRYHWETNEVSDIDI
jgi:hypothetical protein